ncbi:hypothetical protein EOPP23_21000 [Endozoicomonas sp. OPT23]|uniref:hypothetical protein n=1 Tax=Endozoicomonas sp. OPT23 TaxID=2072845 RepID=UPI00129B1520|nr:hypothetical protein [Endozoicomonas sp. OPT23]MRI35442.1 hypothetical protein [Endozoicomonas sp. OPT23]
MQQSEYKEVEPLNFSTATESELRGWLTRLLKIDFLAALNYLCDALDELVWIDLNAEKRWSLVEKFRAVSYTLLTRRLNVIDILTEEQYLVFEQTQRALMSLQMVNKAIVKSAKEQPEQDKALPAKALHRAMADSTTLLMLCYTRHQPVPESLWHEVHLQYKQAKALKIEGFKLEDKTVSRDKILSIEEIYKRSLLLSRSRHNQLSYQDIRLINRALAHWVQHIQLVAMENHSSCFITDLDSDVGLSFTNSFNTEDDRHLLVLDASFLYDKIKKLAAIPSDKRSISLPDRILKHLVEAWNLSTGRKHRRVPAAGGIEICVGFEAVFYHLNGEQSLENYLAEVADPADEMDQFSPDKHDVWSMAHGVGNSSSALMADMPIEFAVPRKKKVIKQHHPIYVCNIVNTCAGGYCLSAPVLTQNQLRSGELVAVREKGRKDWMLATVRWTQVKGVRNLEMGLELLASGSKPCVIVPRKKGGNEREYQHAFLVPKVPAVNSEPTLITPRETFRGGLRFVLLYDDKVRKGQLLECVSSSPGFSQFQYHAQSGLLS